MHNFNTTSEYWINKTNDYVRWKHWDWLLPEIINALLTLITVWLTVSLIHYGISAKKWRRGIQSNIEKLNAGWILACAVLCSFATLFRLINSQFVINVGFTSNHDFDIDCEIVSDSSVIIYGISVLTVYLFLWLRQSVFYSNRMLPTNYGKTLRFLSWLSIFLIFAGGLAAVLVNIIPSNYKASVIGCTYEPIDSDYDAMLFGVSVGALLTGQITLVGLFIYPLHKHHNPNGCFSRNPPSKTSIKEAINNTGSVSLQKERKLSKHSKCRIKIKKIMRRSIVFSIIAIVSDIAFLTVATFSFIETTHRRIPTILYDISAFLNLVFVVSSFMCWKKIITSPLVALPVQPSSIVLSSTDGLKENNV